jgi:integrase-like protein/tripartite tricarboxylate transporter family receptor
LSSLHVQSERQEFIVTKQISPLRQRMIDDMKFRNMSPNTQKVYTYAVANFSAFHGRSPDKLGIEDVREYQLHLMGRGLKATSINPIIGALRFFYGITLGQKEIADQIPFGRKEDTLPDVPTMAESGLPQVGFDPDVWLGFLAPAGPPAEIVDALNRAVNASLSRPELKAKLAMFGFESKTASPQEFAVFLAGEMQKWPPRLRAAGLQAE